MEQGKVRIVIADDHQLIRETWKLILLQDNRFTIVAECANGAEAIIAVGHLLPDIILMDINMHPVNGFEATRKILKEAPLMRIIGISVNNQTSYARNIMKLGAKGFVTKDCSKEEMTNAIVTIHNGGKFVSEAIRLKMNQPGDDELLKH
ncbi:MAG TPA: response regulator transcription factor [Chitinophagaceae bacterium]|nr:response regulator transcription factor [Chitinophagaceae bacterium]